ncbi:MAG: hypothetical protein QW515_04345, partial [Thermoplasmatales archaeon]
ILPDIMHSVGVFEYHIFISFAIFVFSPPMNYLSFIFANGAYPTSASIAHYIERNNSYKKLEKKQIIV